jgi:chromosomal replication initiator protein
VNTDDRDIVAAIRAQLAERIGKDRCEVWFGAATQLAVEGETLVVSVANQFFQDWLRTNFRRDLEASAVAVCGRPRDLEFRIAAPANGGHGAAAPIGDESSVANVPATAAVHSAAAAPARTAQADYSAPMMGRRRFASLDAFVVGDSNCLAHRAAQITADRPGTYSPLLVYGPTGTGKTHLLEGICRAFRQSRPRARAIMLSAEQFTGYFLEALHGSGMPSFRRKYRDLELLVIDDVQFFTNKRATLVELQHTIDTMLQSGRQLVFSADRSPAALRSLGPELMARLSGGMVCRVEPAEYSTRLGIVRRLAGELGMALGADVETYIASHFTSQARELSGALNKLHAASHAHERPISLAFAEETLSELVDHHGHTVKLADIERAVCDVLGINAESLQSTRKAKTVVHPRMLAMWLARKHTRAGLSEIGSYFGRRSHSTVISAQKRIEASMAKASPLKLSEGALSLEEAIRRVESRLRAG